MTRACAGALAPLGTVGMMLQSATRRPATPTTRALQADATTGTEHRIARGGTQGFRVGVIVVVCVSLVAALVVVVVVVVVCVAGEGEERC